MVFSGLVTAWRLAGWPTRRSLSSVKATIDGVVRAPSEFSITFGDLPSMTATQELVVPRSIPMTLPIFCPLFGGRSVWALAAPGGTIDRLSGLSGSPPTPYELTVAAALRRLGTYRGAGFSRKRDLRKKPMSMGWCGG